MPPALVNHGTPVVTSRQWSNGLSPNAAGNGWNYIVQAGTGVTNPYEWVVLKDLTDVPAPHSEIIYQTPTGIRANTVIGYSAGQQLRSPNGRIFFPCYANYTAYYDPVLENVTMIGPFVENPPVNPNASTIPYSASFDVAGLLYFGTQESAHRPSCIVVTDPTVTPPTQTVLGYVGDNANSYTTYGYYLAPDTVAAAKYIYVSYGQDPWQLWALNITPGPGFGTATKLAEVTSIGRITFTNIAGQGWVANVRPDLNNPAVTQYWCLDGAIYPYTPGQPPPVGAPAIRNVTPANTPLVAPPQLDAGGGIGVVGYRNGSSGPYTYVNYTVTYSAPQAIESLINTPDGILGNAAGYQGWFRAVDATGAITWFGAQSPMDISEGPRVNVPGAGVDAIYLNGYPDGVLYKFNPAVAWQASAVPTVNPLLLGFYGPSGNQQAGTKYSRNLAWSAAAGLKGRLYSAGIRDRTGTGAGIGYYDAQTGTLPGTFAAPLDAVQPQGLVALDGLGWIVLSTNTLSGSGDAPLLVFDHDLNLLHTLTPLVGVANLGANPLVSTGAIASLFATSNPDVVLGTYASGGALALFRYDVNAQALLGNVVTGYVGTITATTINQGDGSIWLAVGNELVRVDPNTMATTSELDITTIAPVPCLAFYAGNLYMAGSASAASLWSAQFAQAGFTLVAGAGEIDVTGGAVTFAIGTHSTLAADGVEIEIIGKPVTFSTTSYILMADSDTVVVAGVDARFTANLMLEIQPARSYPLSFIGQGEGVSITRRGI